MRNLIATFAFLAVPSLASAADYGAPGQIELGGLFGIQNQSLTEKPDEGDEEFSATVTAILLQPQVGYFVTDGLALVGSLEVQNLSFKPEDGDAITITTIGLGVDYGSTAATVEIDGGGEVEGTGATTQIGARVGYFVFF